MPFLGSFCACGDVNDDGLVLSEAFFFGVEGATSKDVLFVALDEVARVMVVSVAAGDGVSAIVKIARFRGVPQKNCKMVSETPSYLDQYSRYDGG